MAVEIFQNKELSDILFEIEALDEWKALTNELNLEGQKSLAKGKESPIPYPYINNSMERIFTTLCPERISVDKYNKTPIPLEAIKQLSFSVKEKHFNEIEVWYDDKSPDPILVGWTYKICPFDSSYNRLIDENKKDVTFSSKKEAKEYCDVIGFKYNGFSEIDKNGYLIARWGDEIRPMEQLKSLAKERIIEKYGAVIKNEIEEKNQALKKLNENAILYLSGEISENKLKGGTW